MRGWTRRSLLAGLFATPLVLAGCSIGQLAFFLMPEPKHPPKLSQLGSKEVGEIPRVVILTSKPFITNQFLINADRELAEYVAKSLYEGSMANEENLTVVAPPKVEQFKSANPDWKDMHPSEIGRHFNADHVIVLEINKIKMFEGRNRQLFQGELEVSISLVDVNNPDAIPMRSQFRSVYPRQGFPEVNDIDTTPHMFRAVFLQDAALELAWYFTSHPQSQEYKRN